MSAYGKPSSQIHGYEPNRTYSEQAAFTYTSPLYASQPTLPPSSAPPGYQNAGQLTPMTYPPNQVRAAYHDQAGSYLNVGSTPIPEVTSFQPTSGKWNSKVYVYITSLYELLTSSTPEFSLMFGQRKVSAVIQKLQQNGGVCSYQLAVDVPQFSMTSWASPNVPLCMFMESSEGGVMGKVDVGEFTYTDGIASGAGSILQDGSRKRKISLDENDVMKSPAKRTSNQQLRAKDEYTPYQFAANEVPSSFPNYVQPTNAYGNIPAPFNRSAGAFPAQSQAPSRQLVSGYSYQGTATTSPPTVKAPSPQLSSWNTYPTVGSNVSRSPAMPPSNGIPRPSLSSLPSPTSVANPPLIRTSTLQQTPSPATTPHGGHPGQHFNAYALYPHKAKLEINGDLDSMARNWSQEELDSRRRLVHFKRSQSGSTITTTFTPIGVDERPPNSVCISCIWWQEKEECFVTSVDTIFLLEQLVAARFTVEEKNRIRRNLEGFRPLTVSKGKADSEEFFKVIMAFPNPKPRNIEKDVKVFHWKDLSPALKKIIGKYSASPSSTLPPGPALLTPVSSTGYATETSSIGMSSYPVSSDHHHQRTTSPQSMSGSTSSYNTMPTRVLSPHSQKPMINATPPDLRVSVPHETWSNPQAHHMQRYQQANVNARGAWDMTPGYLDNHNPIGAGSAPPQQYQASRDEGRLQRSLSGNQQIPRP